MSPAFDQPRAAKLSSAAKHPQWLAALADEARRNWLAGALPHSRIEDWKYTSLTPLNQTDYLQFGRLDESVTDNTQYTLAGLSGPRLVFVNGEYSAALSWAGDAMRGQLTRFSQADEAQRAVIREHLGQLAPDQHLFAQLNSAWLEDGVLYQLNLPGQRAEPLHVVHLTTALAQPFTARQRLLVVVEPQCEGTIIEHFASTDQVQNSFSNGVSELVVAEGGALTHYRLHLEEEHAIHIGGVYARLARNARLDSFCLALGGHLKRLDLRVQHQGHGSECQLNGVYLAKGHQHVDLHSTVEHEMPRGTTAEIFRGIVDDQARAVFNGRIHIHPQAQKTVAELSNRNLLLSNRAELYTKPELEIYADDVRCAHGATVSQIDDQALYYMQSRGVERKEAEVMLSFGFINELIDQLPHEPLRQRLRPVLSHWFSKDSRLTRHIL